MISIIIPIYNSEKTLSSCIQSIWDQTYPDYELILIDDGSKDRSGEICDELKETCASRGVRCQVIHKENGGVSSARNCGMDHANGEYFVCVDSDDVVEPCYLEDFVRTAESHPELGHVVCGFKCTSNARRYFYSSEELLTIVSRKDYMRLFDKVLIQSPCLSLYRTEVVRENRLRMREDLSLAEDLLFNLDYLDALGDVQIGAINKTNYIYFDEDQNTLNRKFREDLNNINKNVVQTIALHLKKWGIDDKDSWQKYYNTAIFKYQSTLSNTFNKQNPMTHREKIDYNNSILKDGVFQEALQKCSVNILSSFRRAYGSGDYRKVLAVERLQQIKQAIRKILK